MTRPACTVACDHSAVRRLLLTLSFTLAACAPAQVTAPSAVPSVSPSASPTLTLRPTASPTATPVPSPSPTLAPVPLGGTRADFDCDNATDDLLFFAIPLVPSAPSGPPEPDKLARLVLASGGTHELRFEAEGVGDPLIGTADVNGDGCADAIITVDHGASTTSTAFIVFDGKDLVEADEDGKPAIFLYEGSVRHGNAIECRRTKDVAEVVARGISNYTSEFQWDVVERVYRWSGRSTLALFATDRSVIAVATADAEPPDPGRYWGLSCGQIHDPGWAFTR